MILNLERARPHAVLILFSVPRDIQITLCVHLSALLWYNVRLILHVSTGFSTADLMYRFLRTRVSPPVQHSV